MNTDESELWKHFVEGDKSAFSLIYQQNADTLYAYGLKIVGDEQMVEDCIQNLFVYIYEKRNSLSEPQSIFAYLMISLKRMLLLNREKSFNNVNIDDCEGFEFEWTINEEDVTSEQDVEQEKLKLLNDALKKLSAQQREIIYLRYYKKLCVEDTAEAVNVSKQTVMNVTYNALSRLRKEIGNATLILFLLN